MKFLKFLGMTSVMNAIAMMLVGTVWAQDAAVPAAQPQPPGLFSMLMPMVAVFFVMYFLVIRPKQKELKKQQAMLSALKQGDEILTASGILGKVSGITDHVVTVEVANNVKIKMLKSQVSRVIQGDLKDAVGGPQA